MAAKFLFSNVGVYFSCSVCLFTNIFDRKWQKNGFERLDRVANDRCCRTRESYSEEMWMETVLSMHHWPIVGGVA